MARRSKDVTEAELAVLEVLWEAGPATIRAIAERLYPEGGPSPHATVQKLLERLEGKGCVARRRTRGAHVFRAAMDRQTLVGRRLEDLAERLCGGSLSPVISHLVTSRRLTEADRADLRRLIDEAQGTEGTPWWRRRRRGAP